MLLNIDEPKKCEKEHLILHELIEIYTNFFSFSLYHVLSLYFLSVCNHPLPLLPTLSLPPFLSYSG